MGRTTVSLTLTWILLVIVISTNSAGFMTAMPVITSMLSNSTNPERQGLVMGTSQSLSSGLRAIGPILSGVIISIFTAFNMPYLFFIIFAFGYLICCVFIRRLTPEDLIRINGKKEEVEMEEPLKKSLKNGSRDREEAVGLLQSSLPMIEPSTQNGDIVLLVNKSNKQ